MHQLELGGYLRLPQIIGRPGVTAEEAASNRLRGTGPRRPKQPVGAIFPISKSTWWSGVKSGRFPAPVKLGTRTTVWRISDIRALLERTTA